MLDCTLYIHWLGSNFMNMTHLRLVKANLLNFSMVRILGIFLKKCFEEENKFDICAMHWCGAYLPPREVHVYCTREYYKARKCSPSLITDYRGNVAETSKKKQRCLHVIRTSKGNVESYIILI